MNARSAFFFRVAQSREPEIITTLSSALVDLGSASGTCVTGGGSANLSHCAVEV
ncbi:MAG TPA: hypothetical protein VD994_08425 [Prosthecobacter sp.]|nr:hypothetical protein [Prosthecobacter sp.]